MLIFFANPKSGNFLCVARMYQAAPRENPGSKYLFEESDRPYRAGGGGSPQLFRCDRCFFKAHQNEAKKKAPSKGSL